MLESSAVRSAQNLATVRLPCNNTQPSSRQPRSKLAVVSALQHLNSFSLNPIRALHASLCGVGAATTVLLACGDALADGEKVAEFATSGFLPVPGVFRDTVQVIELDDPEVEGVSLYFTDYSRSLQERLSSDPFSDPSQASLTCAATGPVVVKHPEEIKGSEGRELLNELKTLNLLSNKRTIVRRVYDDKRNVLVYIAYSTRFTSTADEGGVSSSRYRTSICALPVGAMATPAVASVAS